MNKEDQRVGYYAALATTVLTIITFGLAIFTPPLSGPLCTGACYTYPFLDTTSRFPRDYFWMFPAILISVLYLIQAVSLHYYAPQEKKIYSHIGLVFVIIGSSVLITNFFLQLSIIQPSLLNGETDGVPVLSQFNPHGVFIALEEVGYLILSIAFLFMSFIFSGSRVAKAIRWTYTLIFILTMCAFALISYQYGIQREYRFEIAAITINWIGLILSSSLFAYLLRAMVKKSDSDPSAQISHSNTR